MQTAAALAKLRAQHDSARIDLHTRGRRNASGGGAKKYKAKSKSAAIDSESHRNQNARSCGAKKAASQKRANELEYDRIHATITIEALAMQKDDERNQSLQ